MAFCRDIPSNEKIPISGIKNPGISQREKIPNPGDKIPIPEISGFSGFFTRDFFGIFKSRSKYSGFRDFQDFSIWPQIKNPDPDPKDRNSGSRKNPIPKLTLINEAKIFIIITVIKRNKKFLFAN